MRRCFVTGCWSRRTCWRRDASSRSSRCWLGPRMCVCCSRSRFRRTGRTDYTAVGCIRWHYLSYLAPTVVRTLPDRQAGWLLSLCRMHVAVVVEDQNSTSHLLVDAEDQKPDTDESPLHRYSNDAAAALPSVSLSDRPWGDNPSVWVTCYPWWYRTESK
jgi:hypothetical protein